MLPSLDDLGSRAVTASHALAAASSAAKDAALRHGADLLEQRTDDIVAANAVDVARAERADTAASVVDRLALTPARVAAMAAGLRHVAALADPIGETVGGWRRPNGLEIRQVRVPLGVVGIIYENRPNVTSDAAGLCIKSGNAAFLRGSSAAITTNQVVAGVLREGAAKAGITEDAVLLVDDTSRESAIAFMRLRGTIDCLIPRGGAALMAAVVDNATVPYIIDGAGNCHVYVDAAADLAMATALVVDGKTSRPGVCNATESLLVHRDIAGAWLPGLSHALDGVDLVGDAAVVDILGEDRVGRATEDDWGREYLDLRLSIRLVDDLDGAVAHIRRYGSGHTEAIVTGDRDAARRFAQQVDAAAVVVNASTRFTDGEEYGFGAEIGISTQKLHARGPMGVRALTTTKYLVEGDGQIRG